MPKAPSKPPPPPPEDFQPEEEEEDVFEAIEAVEDNLDALQKRVEGIDRTVYYGLRGIVMLIDHLEEAVNPMNEPEKKASALIKVREIINAMREGMK